MDLKIDIIEELSDDDIKQNLVRLLNRKRQSLQVAADCHEYLSSQNSVRNRFVNYTSIFVMAGSFVLSTTTGSSQCEVDASTVNLPWAITAGVSLILKGIRQFADFGERSKLHEKCYKQAMGLSEDIEYLLLKNHHTKTSLQNNLETYEERIKAYRNSEEHIPLNIKQYYLNKRALL